MDKGEQTKQRIVEAAVELINRQGYSGMSMSDLMQRTGLQKGGIYRHFDSKDDIACAAFDQYLLKVTQRIREAIENVDSPTDRLIAIIHTLGSIGWEPVVRGGCMVMNLAIESDFAELPFRETARDALVRMQDLVRYETQAAVEAGELRSEVDPDALASVIVSSIEGAIMMSGIDNNRAHSERVIDHLEQHIRSFSI